MIALAQTSLGLWLGTDRGVLRVGPGGEITEKRDLGDWRQVQRPSALAELQGALYVATEHGLLRFRPPGEWEVRSPPAPPVSLAVDGDRLLVGTENGFYSLADWSSGRFGSPGQIDGDLLLEPRYFILAILPDVDGWLVGTNHGLGWIDRKTSKGSFLFRKHSGALQTACVNGVLPSAQGPGNPAGSGQEIFLCTSMGLARAAARVGPWRLMGFAELRTERKSIEDSELEAEMNEGAGPEGKDDGGMMGVRAGGSARGKGEKPAAIQPSLSNWVWCGATISGYRVFGTRTGVWVRHPKEELWRIVTPGRPKLAGNWVTALLPVGERLLLGTDRGLEVWELGDLDGLFRN